MLQLLFQLHCILRVIGNFHTAHIVGAVHAKAAHSARFDLPFDAAVGVFVSKKQLYRNFGVTVAVVYDNDRFMSLKYALSLLRQLAVGNYPSFFPAPSVIYFDYSLR